MNIVADEQIALVHETFGRIGNVLTLPAEAITARKLRHADVLLIRSVTRVTGELLDGTKVRIIGTATSGIDHINSAVLRDRRIRLISAPGCNARAVAEYVLASLLAVADRKGFRLKHKTIGIIGVGHVGSVVARFCRAMGMEPILNDPLLAIRSKNKIRRFRPVTEILKNADIITLHVPLTCTGRYATNHMISDDFFARLRKNIILVNTSRGAVIDEKSLVNAARNGLIGGLVLDVWEHEPRIDSAVLEIADIGTSHIAGHSLRGRIRGTAMVYEQLCRAVGLQKKRERSALDMVPAKRRRVLSIADVEREGEEAAIRRFVRRICDPVSDGRRLRKYLDLPRSEQPAYFKRLRESYRLRPEFGEIKIKCRRCTKSFHRKLSALGFAH